MAIHSLNTIARFWSKVSVKKPSECWLWRGARHGKNYGHFRLGGRIEKAHRIAYEIAKGEIPPSMHVCHACDNPACCNPAHLWLGTNEDNLNDRQAKGRQAMGTRSGRARLTEDLVREIKTKFAAKVRSVDIARTYGVSKECIASIKHGRSWRHVSL